LSSALNTGPADAAPRQRPNNAHACVHQMLGAAKARVSFYRATFRNDGCLGAPPLARR
jgi:hypothetical protein